jgi:hypothetical protein
MPPSNLSSEILADIERFLQTTRTRYPQIWFNGRLPASLDSDIDAIADSLGFEAFFTRYPRCTFVDFERRPKPLSEAFGTRLVNLANKG